MEVIKKVGFIGLGNMGKPMAQQLINAGFDLTVMDKRQDVSEAFAKMNKCDVAADASALGEAVDVVITMLPTSKIVRTVILGTANKKGVVDGMRRGKLIIDMSTSNPADTLSLHRVLEKRGIELIDAPVAGGVIFAVEGSLFITVGGSQDNKDRAMPLFKAMGSKISDCGILGGAHTMKALNNFVNAAALITGIEAMSIALKFGLDSKIAINALKSACTGRNNPIEKKIEGHILNGKHATGMPIGLIAKDIKIAVESARALGAFAPIAKETLRLWEKAKDEIGFEPDQSEVGRLWETKTGIKF